MGCAPTDLSIVATVLYIPTVTKGTKIGLIGGHKSFLIGRPGCFHFDCGSRGFSRCAISLIGKAETTHALTVKGSCSNDGIGNRDAGVAGQQPTGEWNSEARRRTDRFELMATCEKCFVGRCIVLQFSIGLLQARYRTETWP